jgi:hypothetical protein
MAIGKETIENNEERNKDEIGVALNLKFDEKTTRLFNFIGSQSLSFDR